MLRNAVLAFAVLLAGIGIAGLVVDGSTFPFLLMALVILGGTLFERRRYGAAAMRAPVGPAWKATPERFVDESGVAVRVWFNAATGERRYVADDSAPD
ncbi:MAG: hypothetical protein K2P68_02680 [Sphingomonas sp.]|nr:hypothetical protein [Sphingomonas sp.]